MSSRWDLCNCRYNFPKQVQRFRKGGMTEYSFCVLCAFFENFVVKSFKKRVASNEIQVSSIQIFILSQKPTKF